MMFERAMFVAFMCFVAGCSDNVSGGGAPEPRGSIEDAVTDSAALALADGHFRIDVPALRYGSLSSIDSTQARQYAVLYLAQFWEAVPSGLEQYWEHSHGSPLDLATLAPCGPTRLAESAAYAPLDELPVGSRRVTAEYWLIRFCNGNDETAGFVGVSPYATDLQIVDGLLTWPPLGGAQFQEEGLPARFEEAVLYSPEAAAILARQCTGKRVRAVPRLILAYGQRAFTAKWELVLEGGSRVRVGNALVSADTVYAGYSFVGGRAGLVHEGLVVSAADQPSTIPLTIVDNIPPEPIPPDWVPHFRDITVARDSTIPISFEPISCPGN